jgi:parvulin-like peptidyl-prolyl isomerase
MDPALEAARALSDDSLTLPREWLASRGLLPRVRRERVIDAGIALIELTSADKEAAKAEAEARWNDEDLRAQFVRCGLRPEDVAAIAEREQRIRIFKERNWKAALPAYFLKRKSAFDRVVYWLLRSKDRALAWELYFRIREAEEDFTTVAARHSEGAEADTCGILGPSALGSLAPALAKLLLESEPGKLRQPVQIGEWVVVVRLHKILPCQLDAEMEARLSDELFEQWIEAQLARGEDA